jgi:hypothetical protein
MTANGQCLLLRWNFINVQPGTEACFCFVDEGKNFCGALFVGFEQRVMEVRS